MFVSRLKKNTYKCSEKPVSHKRTDALLIMRVYTATEAETKQAEIQDGKMHIEPFLHEKILSAQILEIQNSFKSLKNTLVCPPSFSVTSSSFSYNIKRQGLFSISFCLSSSGRRLLAATPSTPNPLSSTPTASFLYASCLPLNFPSAQLHVTQLSNARLGSGTSRSPEHRALASEPPAVTSAGPVRCHDAGRVVGKNRTSQA